MGKCRICGKSSLFTTTDSNGRCKDCAAKYMKETLFKQQQAKDEAQSYFSQIIQLYRSMESSIEADADPIKRLKSIPMINEKLQICQKLYSLLETHAFYEYLDDIIMQNITYDSERDKSLGMGRINSLSLIVWTGRSYSQSNIFDSLKRHIKTYENNWKKSIIRINKNAEFQKTLLSLDSYSYELSNDKIKKRNLYDMPELKTSSITSRTSYEKTGTFIVIDTETTGLSCSKHEIIEVAAVYFHNWTPTVKFETFIKPKKEIPSQITALNHITNEMVKDAPAFSQIVPGLLSFIGKHNIVAHNLSFDLDFLYKNGLDIFAEKRKYYDTLELSQKTLRKPSKKWDKESGEYEINYDKDYDVEDYKLDTLCDFYCIRDNNSSHRALSDCLATGFLFQKLVAKRTDTTISSSILSANPNMELLHTKWGTYEMPSPYHIYLRKGPRNDLKKISS